eukprot:scaffold126_cov315-Pavlova_lutheri.AAC.45
MVARAFALRLIPLSSDISSPPLQSTRRSCNPFGTRCTPGPVKISIGLSPRSSLRSSSVCAGMVAVMKTALAYPAMALNSRASSRNPPSLLKSTSASSNTISKTSPRSRDPSSCSANSLCGVPTTTSMPSCSASRCVRMGLPPVAAMHRTRNPPWERRRSTPLTCDASCPVGTTTTTDGCCARFPRADSRATTACSKGARTSFLLPNCSLFSPRKSGRNATACACDGLDAPAAASAAATSSRAPKAAKSATGA